jgi:DtxR family Mn-dependent transcriptional regulator
MSNTDFATEAVQNYLKTIFQLCQKGSGASVQDIAESICVSAPGVSKMLRHLAKHQLVAYTPYKPVHLTPIGEKIALETIRHHRLLELYLMEGLGYGWEQVHSEAERLEHHISEEFEASIERMLGFPAYDPHGDPIPTRDGQMPPLVTATLAAEEDGARLIIRRVTDENEDLLRYLGERGLRPGTAILLVDREPFGGSLRLQVAGREERISPDAARNVFVEASISAEKEEAL